MIAEAKYERYHSCLLFAVDWTYFVQDENPRDTRQLEATTGDILSPIVIGYHPYACSDYMLMQSYVTQ